jgi:hypothetical protein
MMLSRVLAVIAIAAGMMAHDARAQFGDVPGMPGSPGAGGFGAGAQHGNIPTPQDERRCRQPSVRTYWRCATNGRSTVRPSPQQPRASLTFKATCQVFGIYVATEAKLLEALDSHGARCGVPEQVGRQDRGNHAAAVEMAKQVCNAAKQPSPFHRDPPYMDDRLLPPTPAPAVSRGPHDSANTNNLSPWPEIVARHKVMAVGTVSSRR